MIEYTTDPKHYGHIDEIGEKMKELGLDNETVLKIVEKAKKYEGSYDLMVLWDEETNEREKEKTLFAILDELDKMGVL